MPAQVSVNVQVNENGARGQLQSLESYIDKLNKKSINIPVNIGGGGSGGSGGGGSGSSRKQLLDITTIAKQAGVDINNLGMKVKSTTKMVNGALVETGAAFRTTAGEVYKVSQSGVTLEKNYDAASKALDKATKSANQYHAAVRKGTTGAVENSNAYLAQQKQLEALEATEKAQSAARLKRIGQVGAALAAAFVVKNVKEALGTMKEVDTELANIRKVTDESAASIQKLGRQAYSTASKYGVSATAYLSGAADFAKAGYKNYGDLAELAIKTQLVGDVSAETASQFLLSADAAYKFGGNIDDLSTVLDRANVIENNYATSIYKLAEGLPIVASTASMANMSIDELMAGLGTITAVTQETGRKAATALRALILNIEGEIGTVIDEDMTITQESVESMSDALKKYGNEAVKAAQQTGKLVDPMEAIRSLAEAYKSGDLNDQELYNILSSLGGKLRTNQLTAIVTNFDMFSEMLEKIKTSAGSADKEVDVMLDTWQAKSEQLKNSWTELVSTIVESDQIKGSISGLTTIINYLTDAVSDLTTEGYVKSATELEKLLTEYDKLYGEGGSAGKELDYLRDNQSKLTQFEKERLAYLTAEERSLIKQIEQARQLDIQQRIDYLNDPYMNRTGVSRIGAQFTELNRAYQAAVGGPGEKNWQQIAQSLSDVMTEYADMYTFVSNIEKDGGELSEKALNFMTLYRAITQQYSAAAERAAQETETFGDTTGELSEAADNVSASFENTTTSIEGATAALQAFSDAASGNKESAAQGYSTAYKQFMDDWLAGKTDTNAVNAAFDLFFTKDMQSKMGYNMQAMGELLASDLYQGIFSGASGDAGVDFANYIADHMSEGLSEVARIVENADGTFNFEYASAEKLADYFKLPLPAIQALLSALDNYGVEVEMGWEDTQNLSNALQELGINADGTGASVSDVAKGLVQLGQTDAKKISSMISSLAQIGFIKGFENLTPEQIGQAITNALGGGEEVPEVPVDVKVDSAQVQEAVGGAVQSGGAGEATAEVSLQVTGVGDTESLKQALDGIEGVKSVTVTESGAVEAVADINSLEEAIAAVPDEKGVSVYAATSGESNLSRLKSLIDSLQSKNITIRANVSTSGSVPASGSGGGGATFDLGDGTAIGTKNSPGGPTLVNELGPELISDNGRAYIANGGKPAIVNLGKGAIVLTNEETQGVFRSSGVGGSHIHAAASGIPRTGGGDSGGGAAEYFEDRDSGVVAVAVDEPVDMTERKEWLEKFLKQIDANIEYQHNLKNHESEADHYITLAINSIKQLRDEYIQNGYGVDSTEVAELANQIFEYERDLKEARGHAIEDLEEELDNLDARIELAENQNDVRKALELEQEAQKKIAELIQKYRDAGFSDTSDEILSLVNKGYDYSSESENRIKVMREDLIDTIKAIKENQEKEDELEEKQKAVEEGRTALETAMNQRTVRVFNPVTGQWEWVANAQDIKSAEENLRNAETALTKEQQSRELEALQKALESGLGLDKITLGPALSALINGASIEQQSAVADALGMLSGGVATTADTTAKSIFDSVDSHDTVTQYIFNGMVIDGNMASGLTLQELSSFLVEGLPLTENMPL